MSTSKQTIMLGAASRKGNRQTTSGSYGERYDPVRLWLGSILIITSFFVLFARHVLEGGDKDVVLVIVVEDN